MIQIFLHKIINSKTHHLNLFFDENWVCKSNQISYGHDIEASWLLFEAAEVLGEPDILDEVKKKAIKIAEAANEGFQSNGSLVNEKNCDTGHAPVSVCFGKIGGVIVELNAQ